MSSWGDLGMQNGVNSIMECIIYFHDYMVLLLGMIFMFVFYLLVEIFMEKKLDKQSLDSHFLETVWTVIPMGFLFFMVYPSLLMLYYAESVEDSTNLLPVKAIAHQWYWEYEKECSVSDLASSTAVFESRLNPNCDVFYTLEVDNSLNIPMGTLIHLFVTSADVLHAWTVPSLGVKVDAIPGRINTLFFYSNVVGSFYGQCSEICGANHSFMPIHVLVYPTVGVV